MCVFKLWELWRQGSFHHLPALIFHFTAKTSADFSIFFFFLLNFLPVSVSLIQIQHLGVSCAAFLQVAVCCFDLFLGCVKQTNAGAAPLQLPPLMQFSTMWKINSECWHLPHSFGRQRQTESTVSVPPSSKSSYLVFSSCEWTRERRDLAKSSWWLGCICFSSYLFMCLFLHPSVPLQWNEESPVSLHQVWSVGATTSGCTSGTEQTYSTQTCG